MTDKANPSVNRTVSSHQTAVAIAQAGGSDGWVVPASDDYLAGENADLDETQMNAFDESHSGSSFDVTIDAGEGFVSGGWVARDTSTTVTLASSTNGQSVFVGWDKDQSDTVIIGTSGDFASDDRKIEIWEFDTDGSGVTSATDKRDLDQKVGASHIEAVDKLTDPAGISHTTELAEVSDIQPNWTRDGTQSADATGSDQFTLSGTYDVVWLVAKLGNNTGSGVRDYDMRVNGDSNANYDYVVAGGSRTTGDDRFSGIAKSDTGETQILDVLMAGRFGGHGEQFYMNSRSMGGLSGVIHSGENATITSPLDTITLLGDNNFDVRWEVYGRDIDGGGTL